MIHTALLQQTGYLVTPGALTGSNDDAGVPQRAADTVSAAVPCLVTFRSGGLRELLTGQETPIADAVAILDPANADAAAAVDTQLFRFDDGAGNVDYRIRFVHKPVNYAGVVDHVRLDLQRPPY